MIYAFCQETLIRKEHFGTLILMQNGLRYLVSNNFFPVLGGLPNSLETIENRTGLERKALEKFLDNLIEKNILIKTKSIQAESPLIRVVENEFISNDTLSFPRTVYWECTGKCNYNCIHCYSSSGPNGKDDMGLDEAKKIIDELSSRGVEFLNIGGGEPLMYRHIFNVLEYANRLNLMVELTTNGSLVTDGIIGRLKDAGLKFIQVSLDGASEETYLKIRKGGNFSKVIGNIKKLSGQFTVSICMVATKLNYLDTPDLIELSKNLGAKYFRVIPLMGVGRGSRIGHLQLSKKEFSKYNKLILELKKREKNKIYIQLNENLIIPERKNISWLPEDHYGCPAGRTTCGIDPLGNVYPCSYMNFEELNCGNLNEKSLLEIWKESDILKQIREIAILKGKCSNCEHLNNCRGGCRASAYLKNKKLNDSDPLCAV